jgi:N-methylhydantoinase A/oxoprolinase/acetone carboxylase beta subunit
VRARASTAAPLAAGAPAPAPVTVQPAYFRETGTVATPRFDGELLQPGTRIDGPAVIRERTTTVVVYPGTTATVTGLGNYSLEIRP